VTAANLPPETQHALAELPSLIRAKRTRERLTLRAAAAELGVSNPTVQNLENGTTPDLRTLIAVTVWLGIPLTWFAPGAPEPDAYRRGWDDCAATVTAALKRGGS
jgi:transcriptional regulator with XRE-family HTH domain